MVPCTRNPFHALREPVCISFPEQDSIRESASLHLLWGKWLGGKNRQEMTTDLFSSPSLLNVLCFWFGRITIYCSLLLRDGHEGKITLLSEIVWTSCFLSHQFINGTFSSQNNGTPTNGTPANCSPILVYALFIYISPFPEPTGAVVSKRFFFSFKMESLGEAPGCYLGVRTSRVNAARLPASSAQGSPSGSRALHTKHSSWIQLLPKRGELWPINIRVEKTSGVASSSLCKRCRLTWSSGMNVCPEISDPLCQITSLVSHLVLFNLHFPLQ